MANDNEKQKLLTQRQINKALEDREAILKRIADRNEQILEAYEGIITEKDKELLLAEKNAEALKNQLDIITQAAEKGEAAKEQLVEQYNAGKEIKLTYEEIVDLKEQEIKAEKDLIKLGKSRLAQIDASKKGAEYLLESMLGINQKTKQWGLALKHPGRLLDDMGGHLKKNLTATNMMGAATAKLGEAMKYAVNQAAQYMKQHYGFLAMLGKGMEWYDSSRIAARQVGVLSSEELDVFQERMTTLATSTRFTRDEMAKTYQELFQNSAALREASEKDQESMTDMAKTLERRLGVAVGGTAMATQDMVYAFGLTSKEAEKMAGSIAVAAKGLKLDATKAMSDFAAQANNLAKFGLPDIENQFLRMAKVSQQTGISMDSMVSTMEKFTTFEGALNAASKMNAVFGTTIDGLELMDVTMEEGPLKGFIKLKEQMEAGGIQMDKLNYAQMRSLKDSLGLTEKQIRSLGKASTADLQRIAAGTYDVDEAMSKLHKGQKDGETSAESQKKAQDDLAKAMQTVADAIMETKKWFDSLMASLGTLGTFLATGGAVMTGIGLLAGGIGMIGARLTAAAGAEGAGAFMKTMGAMGSKMTSLAGIAGGLAAAVGGIALAYMSVKAARDLKDKGYKKSAAAVGIGGGAIGGALTGAAIGSFIPVIGTGIGAAIGAGVGALGGGVATFMHGEQNYVSQPTNATVGEKPELITKRTQRALDTGSSVLGSGAAGGATELKLTVNLVTKEGKIMDTADIKQTFDPNNQSFDAAVSYILNEKLNLIFG